MIKILVVENDLNIQKLARANLLASGYEVVTADNGEEGLRLAQAVLPALILLDLAMPGTNGWEVIKALKETAGLKDIPVIIMTASPGQSREHRAEDMGAAGYLSKPFTVDELLSAIGVALGE